MSFTDHDSSIQFGGYWNILPPETYFDLGALKHFKPKNQTRKTDKIHKDFELYFFMYNFLWQTVLIFPIYILFKKRIETFWFRDISNTQDIITSCFKYFQVYFLVQLYRNQKRKTSEIFTKIFTLYQVSQRF